MLKFINQVAGNIEFVRWRQVCGRAGHLTYPLHLLAVGGEGEGEDCADEHYNNADNQHK